MGNVNKFGWEYVIMKLGLELFFYFVVFVFGNNLIFINCKGCVWLWFFWILIIDEGNVG